MIPNAHFTAQFLVSSLGNMWELYISQQYPLSMKGCSNRADSLYPQAADSHASAWIRYWSDKGFCFLICRIRNNFSCIGHNKCCTILDHIRHDAYIPSRLIRWISLDWFSPVIYFSSLWRWGSCNIEDILSTSIEKVPL